MMAFACRRVSRPYQVVILPILRESASRNAVIDACSTLSTRLESVTFAGEALRIQIDLKGRTFCQQTLGMGQKGRSVHM